MNRTANLSRTARPNRLLMASLWLLIALALASTVHADGRASGSASATLHHSAALAQQHAEHLGNRMQATAHRVMDATSRSLQHALEATERGTHRAAEALERAADRARAAFHNI